MALRNANNYSAQTISSQSLNCLSPQATFELHASHIHLRRQLAQDRDHHLLGHLRALPAIHSTHLSCHQHRAVLSLIVSWPVCEHIAQLIRGPSQFCMTSTIRTLSDNCNLQMPAPRWCNQLLRMLHIEVLFLHLQPQQARLHPRRDIHWRTKTDRNLPTQCLHSAATWLQLRSTLTKTNRAYNDTSFYSMQTDLFQVELVCSALICKDLFIPHATNNAIRCDVYNSALQKNYSTVIDCSLE